MVCCLGDGEAERSSQFHNIGHTFSKSLGIALGLKQTKRSIDLSNTQ